MWFSDHVGHFLRIWTATASTKKTIPASSLLLVGQIVIQVLQVPCKTQYPHLLSVLVSRQFVTNVFLPCIWQTGRSLDFLFSPVVVQGAPTWTLNNNLLKNHSCEKAFYNFSERVSPWVCLQTHRHIFISSKSFVHF